MTTRELIKKHYQPLLAGALLLAGLLVFGVIQLVNSGTSQAERLKNLGDRYYNSHNVERAIQHYEWALEADAGFEEVYFLLFDIYTKQGDIDKVRDVSLRGIEHIRAEHERFAEIYRAATDYVVEFIHHAGTFEQVIRPLINKPEGDIWRSDLDTVTVLDMSNRNRRFSSLEDFVHFKNLQSLTLSLAYNASVDLSDLAHMDKLTELHINSHGGRTNADISTLSALTGLEILTLRSCRIDDLSPLSLLLNLKHLNIGSNSIVDLSPLSSLRNLNHLNIGDNSIVDISPLSSLRNLNHLDIGSNRIVDLSPLSSLRNLNYLNIGGNSIVDLSPLTPLGSLNRLYMRNNQVVDLSPLAQLTALEYVDLNDNPLSLAMINDRSATAHIKTVFGYPLIFVPDGSYFIDVFEEFGSDVATILQQQLNMSSRFILNTELENLEHFTLPTSSYNNLDFLKYFKNLQYLYLNNCTIGDISALWELTGLSYLTMDRVSAGGGKPVDIRGIENLTSLISFGLYNTDVLSFSPLSGLKSLASLSLYSDFDGETFPRLNISGLAGLVSLERLNIYGYTIDDLSPLRSLTALEELYLSRNRIADLSPLVSMTDLTGLELNYNGISDISALSGMTGLNSLGLNNNNITDVSALSGLTNLQVLELTYNNITDVRPLASLTNLTRQRQEWTDEFGQTHTWYTNFLYLYGNPITDFSSIRHITGDMYDYYNYETWQGWH
jgi:internalin A